MVGGVAAGLNQIYDRYAIAEEKFRGKVPSRSWRSFTSPNGKRVRSGAQKLDLLSSPNVSSNASSTNVSSNAQLRRREFCYPLLLRESAHRSLSKAW
jgi:hypothetical protein